LCAESKVFQEVVAWRYMVGVGNLSLLQLNQAQTWR